jgi:hypothetical protein
LPYRKLSAAKIDKKPLFFATITEHKPKHFTLTENSPDIEKLFQPGTSSDWKPRAEHLGRSLDAYTPTPSNPSSMGALVHD